MNQKIAATIAQWMVTGERLDSRGRAVRPGDILILVQSRSSLVELLMRALKEKDVPVAGIDRMTLSEEIAVMDLAALATFALQPRDDLTLATVLKSPLCGMSEENLFDLCHGRTGDLWQVLRKKQPDLAAWFRPLVDMAGRVTPYEFFAHVLATPCPADTVSGRRAFYARLSPDIHDALDEFLNAALNYEQQHIPSLQSFVDWFMRGETEIKREQDTARQDQVRIMTVHAAKGLQAPIVFLPDCGKIIHDHNKGRARFLWPEDDRGVPLWSPRKTWDAPAYETLRLQAAMRQDEEYRRLLYVALTRAEDRLYMAASSGGKPLPASCWYNLIEKNFPPEAQRVEVVENEEPAVLLQLKNAQTAPPESRSETFAVSEAALLPLPDFVFREAPLEPSPSQPLSPSRPGDEEPAGRGPLDDDGDWKFKRGNIVHRVLELLPDLPAENWPKALSSYLARPAFGLTHEQQESFAQEILAVLNHPEFAPIFGPGSRAEVPLIGLAGKGPSAQAMSGQIDRLLVKEGTVWIVDYKTNRPPPQKPEDIPVIYLKQMAAYENLARKIYPDHVVKCALLWTDGPSLMPISEKLLDPYVSSFTLGKPLKPKGT